MKYVVCHLIEQLGVGGAETFLYRLASGQQGGRYAPMVCALRGGPVHSLLAQRGIPCVILERARPSIVNVPRFLFQMTSIVRALARTIRDHRVSVLHAHLQDSNVLGALVGAYCQTAVVGTYQGLGILPRGRSRLDPRNALRRRLYRMAGRLSDRTVAVSTSVRDRLCREIGLDPEKTLLVPNGIDTAAFARARARPELRRELGVAEGRPVITCVGRLIPEKNQRVVVRAMGKVLSSFPQAVLLLVGDGPCAQEIRAQVSRDGVERSVVLAGERTDVVNILASTEIFVLASDAEGIPLSLIEAMAAAKPVIATRVPGNIDVLRDSSCGILVPPRDPDALADAIVGLLSDPAQARSLGGAGQAHVQKEFDIRETVARIESIYDDVLSERAARGGGKAALP